jgi:multidrug efflux pump
MRYNISEWGLGHQPFTAFLMILLMLGGLFAYFRLGQKEDPEFTFRIMVVKTLYPGATAREVEQQVTDRLEKKLQELPYLDYLRSYSKPGESVIFITPRQDVPPGEVPYIWYLARKKISDIGATLPPETRGPFFNDEFGDTYTSVLAFSFEGFSYPEAKDYVDAARQQLLRIPHVEKVDLIGPQDEKVYVEFSDRRLVQLGLTPAQVASALQSQNALVPAGIVDLPSYDVPLRVTGRLDALKAVSGLALRVNGADFRMRDIAAVRRGLVDPPEFKMHFNGHEVIGLGITINKSGDVIQTGEQIEQTVARIRAELPQGIEIDQVANQPRVVRNAVAEFMHTFAEALVIVMIVAGGHRRSADGPTRARRDLSADASVQDRLPAHLARRARAGTRTARGRRDDRGRDDGAQARRGHGSAEGGELCLHLHGLRDAHRNAHHGSRFPAGRPCAFLGR